MESDADEAIAAETDAEPDAEVDADAATDSGDESSEESPDAAADRSTDDPADASVDETDESQVDEFQADAAPADDSAGRDEGTPAQDEESATDLDETPAETDDTADSPADDSPAADVPEDVRKYARFKKMDGAQYDRVNEFLRDRTYITAREWAIARLCADFRTETGVEMTKIGENLPELVPFMTDTYTPQAVNQARSSFENKVRQAGATFLYGAMSGFFTAEELDDMMYEVTEVAKFLLEVEGVDLSVEEELEAEDRISDVMREVQSASEELRHDELACPNCGHELEAAEADTVEGDD
ncbi:hypothetical protein G9466_18075 [Halorussus sp. JP-T4]|nr:hypothetical protein [Halorussus sp. JP-T4]